MKTFKLVLTFLFGLFLILGGVSHFMNPEMYARFFPNFALNPVINVLAGVTEIGLGIGLFIPKFRSMATLAVFVLMLVFLPLHIIDVFRTEPAVGTHQIALIRLPMQFVLILWAWFINKK
jgi:uncharacterized membrane protein